MKLILWIVEYFVYIISFLVPKDKSLCVYNGALDNFIDNEKYCFIYASNRFKQIKHVWVTNNKEVIIHLQTIGLRVVKQHSFLGVYLTLRAAVVIYGSGMLCPYLTGGAIRCNLWHGIPLKKIHYDDDKHFGKYKLGSFRGWILRSFAPDTFVLTTSYNLVELFKRAFNVEYENVIVGGYYRTLPFFMTKHELKGNIMKYENEKYFEWLYKICDDRYTKRIIYMPTFRDAKPNFLSEAIPDFETLNKVCLESKILFILKLHRYCEINVDLSKYSNVCVLENSIDVYPLLPFTDVLITDYSSIFFDYALMEDKNIIYYPFDLEYYRSNSRNLYFDYADVVGENIAHDFNELLYFIQIKEYSGLVISRQFYDDKLNFDRLLNRVLL